MGVDKSGFMQKIRFRRNPFSGLYLCVSLVWQFGHARLLGAVGLFGCLSMSYVSSPPFPSVPAPARTRKLSSLAPGTALRILRQPSNCPASSLLVSLHASSGASFGTLITQRGNCPNAR